MNWDARMIERYGEVQPCVLVTCSGGAARARTASSPVSGSPYAITCALGTLTSSNYSFSFIAGQLTVTKVTLTVTTNNKTRAYGSANPTFDATLSGFVNGETVAVVSGSPSFSGTGPSSTATTTVGNYVITPAVGTLSATNYDFTPFVNGTLHITQATLTITATNRTKVFGATYTPDTTPPSVDFNVSGLLNSDSVTSITLTCAGYAAGATVAGSPYTITPSAAMGTGLTNYTIGYVNGIFTVSAWTITGFYQPVDMGGVVNTVKGGSTVPLKFNIYAGGVERTSVSDVMYQSVQVAEYNCQSGTEDPMGDLPNTGATALRYDTTGHQFIQNWKTPNTKNKCYVVRVTTITGVYIQAYFKTK
jgi:hypothetical protein